MKKVTAAIVLLVLCSIYVLGGEYLLNDTGETVYGLRVVFSEPVRLRAFGDALTHIEPTGPTLEFLLTGGELSHFGFVWLAWEPASAGLVSREWLFDPTLGASIVAHVSGSPRMCSEDCDCSRCFVDFVSLGLARCVGNVFYPDIGPSLVEDVYGEHRFVYPHAAGQGRRFTRTILTGYVVEYRCIEGRCTVVNRIPQRQECEFGCDVELNLCVCAEERTRRYFCRNCNVWEEYVTWNCRVDERLFRICGYPVECCRILSELPSEYGEICDCDEVTDTGPLVCPENESCP